MVEEQHDLQQDTSQVHNGIQYKQVLIQWYLGISPHGHEMQGKSLQHSCICYVWMNPSVMLRQQSNIV